jgi:hypothetical protein
MEEGNVPEYQILDVLINSETGVNTMYRNRKMQCQEKEERGENLLTS